MKDLPVTTIQTCKSITKNKRIKGIRIAGSAIGDDASISYIPVSDEDTYTNCNDDWGGLNICPTNAVATGVVIHTEDVSNKFAKAEEKIVGLQLICRQLTLK